MEMEEEEGGGGGGDEGKRLAEVVKETHRLLRTRYKEAAGDGAQAGVWTEHLGREEQLQRYAEAMHTLATRHWPSETEAESSRVGWVRAAVRDYYWGGGMTAAMEKEKRKVSYLGFSSDMPRIPSPSPEGKIRVLDVGSCYNPFLAFPEFEVTAIDLYPAHQSVLKGDFLNLEITEEGNKEDLNGCPPPSSLQQARGKADQQPAETKEGDDSSTSNTAEHQEQQTEQAEGGQQRPAGAIVKEREIEGMRMEGSQGYEIEENEETGGGERSGVSVEGGEGGKDSLGEVRRGRGGGLRKKMTCELEEQTQKIDVTDALQCSTPGRQETAEGVDVAGTAPSHSTVTSLPAASFDVVVLSLVLEYLPAPTQRRECCERAWRLLVPGGLLAIVTPDSRHQGVNAHLYQLWRVTLAGLGFGRIKYSKQPHFHGLVFRKGFCREAWQGDAPRFLRSAMSAAPSLRAKLRGIDYSKVDREMYIPQDFDEEGTQRQKGSAKVGTEGQGRRKRGRKECEGESKAREVKKVRKMNEDKEVVDHTDSKSENCETEEENGEDVQTEGKEEGEGR